MVQPPEVIAEAAVAVGLRNHYYRARPGAGRLLDDPNLYHPADFLLISLTASLQDVVGPLSDHHSWWHFDLVLKQYEIRPGVDMKILVYWSISSPSS